MPSMNVMQLIDNLQPGWSEAVDDGIDPPGNFYAGALKQIHDDSASVFPASEYSSPLAKENRWKSMVKSDYIPIEQQGGAQGEPAERKACKPLSPKRDKHIQLPKMDDMFNKWRVPSRLTNDHRSRAGSAPSVDWVADNTQLPTIQYRASSMKAPSTARGSCRPQTQHSGPPQPMSARPDISMERQAPGSPSFRNKFRDPSKPKSLATKQVLRNYQNPDPKERTAAELLRNATDHEKKLIEAALRSYKNVKPNGTKAVDSWLENASSQDKEMAMKFFQSNMVSKSPSAQRKMSSVMRKMHKGETDPFTGVATSNKAYGDDADFRYLRLLTPNTRANKWQYQTWHHMPPYVDTDPVWNKTAIYTEPQRIPPRHFVIHPDLG